jgi:hypothetical protein
VIRFAKRPKRFEGPAERPAGGGAEDDLEPNLALGVSDHFPFAVWLRAP